MHVLNRSVALIVLILPACEDKSAERQDPSASSTQLALDQPGQTAKADLPGRKVVLKNLFEPGKRYAIKQVQEVAITRVASFGNETDTSESSERYEMLLSLDFAEGDGSGRKAIAGYDQIDGSVQFPGVGGDTKTIGLVSEEGKRLGLNRYLDAVLELELELAFDQNGTLVKRSGPISGRPQIPLGNGINTGAGSDLIEQLVRSFTEGFPEESIEPGHRWKHTRVLPTSFHGEIELLCDYTYDGMELPPTGASKLAKVSFTAKIGEARNAASEGIPGNMTSKLEVLDCIGAMYFDVEKKSIVYTTTDVKLRTVNYNGEDEIGSASSEIALVNELVSVGVERTGHEE